MAFDPFRFLEERRNGLPVSDIDKSEFVLFNVVQAISMDQQYRAVAHALNELSFSHLPRDIQAMTLQGINRVRMDTRWCRAKGETLKGRDEKIERAMRVFGMSHHDVVQAMRYNLVDNDAVEEKYYRMYEPAKLLELYGGKKKRATRKEHAAGVNGATKDGVSV